MILEVILWYTEVIESKELNFFISRYSILIIEMLWWCYFRWKNVGQKVMKEIRFWFTTFFFLASVPTNRLSLIYYTDRWEKEVFWCIEIRRHIWIKILLYFSMRKNHWSYFMNEILIEYIRFMFWQHFKVPTAWLLFEQIMFNSNIYAFPTHTHNTRSH